MEAHVFKEKPLASRKTVLGDFLLSG